MFKKRGQQSSFGMSFGMIFSIFLIIVFVAAAFIVIKIFLGTSDSLTISQFYSDLEGEVNRAWRMSNPRFDFEFNLPSGITHVCFANLSAPITGSTNVYDELQHYTYYEANVFLIPPGEAGKLDFKFIDNLDISGITSRQNPYCVSNPGKLTISKGMRAKYVMIE